MGGKISIYNLGQLGVDVVKSPVHIDDGAFTKAQNAQVDSVQGVGGIRRRDGMAKLNSSALAGSVQGMIGLPLPDNTKLTRHFFIGFDDSGGAATGAWRTSTDGTTWTTIAVPGPPVVPQSTTQWAAIGAVEPGRFLTPWVALNNKLYYPGNDYTGGTTNPTIHAYDGTADVVVATIPPNPFIAAMTPSIAVCSIFPYSSTKLVVTVIDTTTRGRVLLLDVTSGRITHVGPQSDINADGYALPLLTCLHGGRLWFSSWNGGGAVASKAYSCAVGEPTWTHDTNGDAPADNGYCTGIASFLGNLIVGTAADVGAAGLVRRRLATDGSWSTIRTIGSTTQGNNCSAFIVSADGLKLYLFENLNDVTGGTTTANKQRILSYDGTTFSTEYDVGANLTNQYHHSGYPCFDSTGDLYWPVMIASNQMTQILKRTAAGSWSIVDNAGKFLRGPLTRISY